MKREKFTRARWPTGHTGTGKVLLRIYDIHIHICEGYENTRAGIVLYCDGLLYDGTFVMGKEHGKVLEMYLCNTHTFISIRNFM